MRKCIAFRDSPEPLQITSVLTVDGLKGHVYIEAFKKTHVTQAIEGINSLRMGMNNQHMVPIKEMTDVLKVGQSIDWLIDLNLLKIRSIDWLIVIHR